MRPGKKLSARKLAVLYLLDAPDESGKTPSPLGGTTKLQKLLFLLERQSVGQLDKEFWELDFAYEPQKYGPADISLYRDLEFLTVAGHINMGGDMLTSDVPSVAALLEVQQGEVALVEAIEEEELSFQYLMAPSSEEVTQEQSAIETTYEITPKGVHLLERLEKSAEVDGGIELAKLRSACRSIRAQFGSWPLKRLLEYVYRNHPDMITESTIKDRVLGR